MKQTFILAHELARRRAMAAVADAPAGYVITVAEPTRNLDQNARFHAMCSEMKGVPYYGKARSAEDWKTLFVSGHTMATGGMAEVIPGLEGEFVNIRESTARMSKARASSLIDYTGAYIAQHQTEAA